MALRELLVEFDNEVFADNLFSAVLELLCEPDDLLVHVTHKFFLVICLLTNGGLLFIIFFARSPLICSMSSPSSLDYSRHFA